MLADKIKEPYKIILSSGPRGGKSVISKKIAEIITFPQFLSFIIQ